MNRVFLGIDTSNYTSSISITDSFGNIIADKRRLLDVKEGARGLRQSDALFLHIKNLPELFREIDFGSFDIAAVGASFAPRNAEGSYMPVFLGGSGAAQMIAKTHNVPYFEFSHQEGHIKAGLYKQNLDDEDFYAVHMSGGTTEILNIERNNERFHADIAGKTLDISAGQLIDRVGVKLGYSFPCGKALDEICLQTSDIKIPEVCVKGSDINFSGTETHFLRLIDKGVPHGEIAYLVFSAIAKTMIKAITHVFKTYGEKKVLFVGGVASNSLIRNSLKDKFDKNAYFADCKYSTDNAVGISLMTKEAFERGL